MVPNTNQAPIEKMSDAHKENERILGYLVNELQGIVEGGKLSALYNCWLRSKEIVDVLSEPNNRAFQENTTTI